MLDRGHSVTDIKEHLTNTATLVGEQIPTTWSSKLKMLKKFGYTNPYHYKVHSIGTITVTHLYDKS